MILMRLRFKTILVLIFILIIICASVGIGYLFYTEVVDSSDIVVDGDLIINYDRGSKFSLIGDASLNFSVTNKSDEQKYYYIQFTDVTADDVDYKLTSSNNLDISEKLTAEIISNQIAINGNETVEYTLNFSSSSDLEYSGKIKIGLRADEDNSFADAILNANNISSATLSNIGEPATLDEGLLQAQDDLGIAYYFRGAVTNNNVSFADYNWKIVKINGDGSVKLVLNNILEEIGSYYDSSFNFNESNVLTILNEWYDDNLSEYSDYIAYYRYCNDIVLAVNGLSYNAYDRIVTNKIPTFVCLGAVENSQIGLLTADEVILAGGSVNANQNYYLYNSDITTDYYTMTSAKINGDVYYPFIVNVNGALESSTPGNLLRGIRPVINIIKTAKVTGTGTNDDPYKIVIK